MASNRPELTVHPGQERPASSAGGSSALAELLQFEGELRRPGEVMELLFLLANETRRVVPYDQLFVMRAARIGGGFEVAAVSSLPVVDRNAPLIQGIERVLGEKLAGLAASAPAKLDCRGERDDLALQEYPFPNWYWHPFADPDGEIFGGMLFAREGGFKDNDAQRIARVADTAGHAWRALTGNRPVRRIRKPTSREKKALLIALGLAMIFPVRLTALAPVEVVAARPFSLTAPINGVISRVEVIPNAPVRKGQALVTFDDLKLGNEVQLARERVGIAQARAERANSEAFDDQTQAREISIARSELELARADLAYAEEMAARGSIVAPQDGMAIFSDRRDLEGRAVQIGEPIMQIADPEDVIFRIDLPAKEQLSLRPGSPVEIYLDSSPLWAIDARLETASYQARMTPEGVMAFALTARSLPDAARIGSRGTAKVNGSWVPLIYSLLRRPIASMRQTLGF